VIAVTNQAIDTQYTLPQLAGADSSVLTKGFVLCGFSAKLPADLKPPDATTGSYRMMCSGV
jgi:hypothetical protein